MRKRVLLLIPTTSYRTQAFIDAAHRIGVDLTVASEHPSVFEEKQPSGLITLSYQSPSSAVDTILQFTKLNPINAVAGVDDQSVVLAAMISEALSLLHNSVESVSSARNKFLMRQRMAEANVQQPQYKLLRLDEDLHQAALQATYPCVLKPLTLAASRGVIRVNDAAEFPDTAMRIKTILSLRDVASMSLADDLNKILIEEFIPGIEVSLEGILSKGRLQVLAIFDKPDPLEGPYFEETIYLTPSRLSSDQQEKVIKCAQNAVGALGLHSGPVHVEIRLNERGTFLIEIAARSIGGFCSRSLRFVNDAQENLTASLEEVILLNSLGIDVRDYRRESSASGVMMIPIPKAGILDEATEVEAARAVKNITEVVISAHQGDELVPLPEGGKYLGFIFSRANDPHHVDKALREAHRCLKFEITTPT